MRSPTTRTPSDDSSSLASRTPSRVLDQKFQALIAQATGSQSPALNTMAFYDWMVHLMASPGKQLELWQLATQMLTELHRFAVESRNYTLQEKLAPLVGLRAADPVRYPVEDHRFADPAWQDWPFSLLQQGYLMQERWWRAATQNVPGVDPHHADWVSFCAHQWISMYSPANFALTNPMVLHRTKEEHGANLARGLKNFFDDMQRKLHNAPAAITEDFVVGKDLAATPGKVVLRTELMELIQYSPTTDKVRPEPVLIVPAWIMKYYILDLSPHNSMIRYLVAQGHTVFAISWKNPGLHEHNLGMEDYLREGLYAAIDAMKVKFGRPDDVKQTRITLVRPERDRSLVYALCSLPMFPTEDGVKALREVYLPMMRGSVAVALLVVFVDCVKELPATLLLRPFNYNTLATRMQELASLERLGQAAPAALMVVAVSLVAVALVARMDAR